MPPLPKSTSDLLALLKLWRVLGLAFWRTLSRRQKLAAKAGGGLFLLMLALTSLPELGLRWGIGETLRRIGIGEVSVAETDVELFGGRLAIRNVLAHPRIGHLLGLEKLSFAFRWLPLFRREISVQSLDLTGLALSVAIEGGTVSLNGVPIAAAGSEGAGQTAWTFDIDSLRLAGSKLEIVKDGHPVTVAVELLEILNLRNTDPQSEAAFRFKGSLDGSPLELTGTAKPFAEDPLFELAFKTQGFDLGLLKAFIGEAAGLGDVAGRLTADLKLSGRPQPGRLSVRGQGDLRLEKLKLAAGGIETTIDAVMLKADDLLWEERGNRLDWQGGLKLDGANLAGPAFAVEPQGLVWNGRTALSFDKDGPAGRIEGSLRDDGAKVVLPSLQYRHGKANLSGAVDLGSDASGGVVLSSQLALDAADLNLRDPKEGGDLMNAEKIEAKAMRLNRLQLAADGGLSLDELALDGLGLRLLRKPSKQEKAKLAPEPLPANDAPRQRMALRRFSLGGGSWVEFVDSAASQPVRITFDKLKVGVSGVDSASPQRAAPFEMAARVGASSIEAKGEAKPFANALTLSLDSKITAFELPPLSPYVADALGVQIETGHFDGKIDAALEEGALKGKIDLELSNLFAAAPDPEAPLAKQAGMPVDTILNLLRDKDDRIHLTIPVSGNLADPQFDLSDAISQAVGGALRSTVMTTLKVVFPVLALIEEIADQDGPALAPITFKPGSEQADDQGKARLGAIGELLKGRPAIRLSVCPVASVSADWPVLLERAKSDQLGVFYKLQKMVSLEAKPEKTPPDRAVLTALAEKRAASVTSELSERWGVDAGRLYACLPRVENEQASKPRAELKL
jgi:hypothetical protein